MKPTLFTPFELASVTLPNRIVVSPMCQYSADDGAVTDWHLQHLMQLAISGAGLIMVEATAVEPIGRITHGCLGLYRDSQETRLERVLRAARKVAPSGTRFGIQLAHAGRKASVTLPWQGNAPLTAEQQGWSTVGPSDRPFADGWPTPRALSERDMADLVEAFVEATDRAVRLGFDVIELHFGNGYLGHQFLSPLANTRSDAYGGSRAGRQRFPLQLAEAVHDRLPASVAMGVRLSATDWVDGGADLDDAIAFASQLRAIGSSYVCVTSGSVVPAKIPSGPAFLAPHAGQIRAAAAVPTRVSGMIATPEQAEAIVSSGQADLVAIARGFLDDPRWVWHAAEHFGVTIDYPPQYQRSRPDVWPGAQLAHRR
ncbi:NADH:flavin oxidoreductase/NADH oxidase [Enhygromyxa salina]|uniref:NADPH dehydrogenase n=1 Tax=Enhygromyxa salina TaxID=215803 RepID=A0A2S9YWE1_9BACT|nr:NADH:flavin oxidoreductase/NADH oxidase [Enhygromyxa salina]PRQ09418.1 NADPH dehydrogenase [Enhygromyxa salina]